MKRSPNGFQKATILAAALAISISLLGPFGTAQAASLPQSVRATVVESKPVSAVESRPMGWVSTLFSLAKSGYDYFGKYQECLKNAEVGQPCNASDSDNIREILRRLVALEKQIQQNHQDTTARLQQLQDSANKSELMKYVDSLNSLETNGENAMQAYLAMSECLAAAKVENATCQAYIGGSTRQAAQPVAQATAATKAYFLQQVQFMGTNIDEKAAYFTGTAGGRWANGLAYWVQQVERHAQNMRAGVTNSTIEASRTLPVIFKPTVDQINSTLRYYAELFNIYGFLVITAAGETGGSSTAQSAQSTVDYKIVGASSAGQVAGSIKNYALPSIQANSMIMREKGHPVILSSGTGLSQPMRFSDVEYIAAVLNVYSGGKTTGIERAYPGLFARDRWYTVQVNSNFWGGTVYTCLVYLTCANRMDVKTNVLVAANERNGTGKPCPSHMRPMDQPTDWNSKYEYYMYSEHLTMPKNFLWDTWNAHVRDRAVEYQWDLFDITTDRGTRYDFGWGAFPKCVSSGYTTKQVLPEGTIPLLSPN